VLYFKVVCNKQIPRVTKSKFFGTFVLEQVLSHHIYHIESVLILICKARNSVLQCVYQGGGRELSIQRAGADIECVPYYVVLFATTRSDYEHHESTWNDVDTCLVL